MNAYWILAEKHNHLQDWGGDGEVTLSWISEKQVDGIESELFPVAKFVLLSPKASEFIIIIIIIIIIIL
jgi:hypothetical protein